MTCRNQMPGHPRGDTEKQSDARPIQPAGIQTHFTQTNKEAAAEHAQKPSDKITKEQAGQRARCDPVLAGWRQPAEAGVQDSLFGQAETAKESTVISKNAQKPVENAPKQEVQQSRQAIETLAEALGGAKKDIARSQKAALAREFSDEELGAQTLFRHSSKQDVGGKNALSLHSPILHALRFHPSRAKGTKDALDLPGQSPQKHDCAHSQPS